MIGEAVLLALITVAALSSASNAPPDIVSSPAPPEARSQADQSNCEGTDGIPISLTIKNDGQDDDRLLGASSPIANCVTVHQTRLIDGRRQGMPVPDGLVIPASTTILLEPGSSHLAMLGLRTDLIQGESFPLTLYFDRAGTVTVVARVRRKVDAAGTAPLPPVLVDELTISLASAPPAPVATPVCSAATASTSE